MKWRALWLSGGLALCAWAWGQAAWIEAKAVVAQVLLEQAWASSLTDQQAHPPWPWADTHPVARLRVPRLGVDQIVLAGASGRTLAFGPGHLPASAPVNTGGTVILAGHRDTHFAFLRHLTEGDVILLTSRDRETRRYRVTGFEIIDARETRVSVGGSGLLVLSTCYPFDALVPGGPIRYLVFAQARAEPGNHPMLSI